jgi:hypothetical protein
MSMSKTVYANGNAVACKDGDVKVVAAFPDVCQSPPGPPTGPVPVPYAASSFARDLRAGSKSVKIGGQPIALKNKSYFKSAPLGNEAATKSFGAGVASHQIGGKTYFAMWSMDVRAEGENLCRHNDIATSNHGSNGNTPGALANDRAAKPPADPEAKPKCECCGNDMHEGQLGPDGKPGPVVSEEEWYMIGPDEDVALEAELQRLADTAPHPDSNAMKYCDKLLDKLAERETKLVDRRRDIARGKAAGCGSFPEPPCNVYRVLAPGASEAIEKEWEVYREKYQDKYGYPKMSKTNHRVPKSAGGCPGNTESDNNLVHDQALGEECLGFDLEVLTPIQTRCSQEWAARLKSGWTAKL